MLRFFQFSIIVLCALIYQQQIVHVEAQAGVGVTPAPTFIVSTMAFNPPTPLAITNITLMLQPSIDLSSTSYSQKISMSLPSGFASTGKRNSFFP